MSSILYYVSGHGFGHAVRSRQVIRSLRELLPDFRIYVKSTAPRWLFEGPGVAYDRRRVDVGIIQEDSLEMDLGESVIACRAVHDQASELAEEEVAFIKSHKVRLILGDIPPLCFEIAARASIPSVAITNFTWDWIYRAYLADYPAFLPLIQEMESFYRKAALALSLPFSCNLDLFPNRKPIPLITRLSTLDKTEARKKFGLPGSAIVVLLSFGGFGLKQMAWDRLRQEKGFFFVTTGESLKKDANLHELPNMQPHYEDLVRAADLIVSKPGYGIVADAIAHRVPILYTSRGKFPEYEFLVKTLKEWATEEFIPQEELRAGRLAPYLRRLLEKAQNWPSVRLDGAQVAATECMALLRNT